MPRGEVPLRLKYFALMVAILLAQGAATAAPPLPMTPTGPWNVEFADSMCLLRRAYGKNGGKIGRAHV